MIAWETCKKCGDKIYSPDCTKIKLCVICEGLVK